MGDGSSEAITVSCAVVAGTTTAGTSVLLTATGTRPTTATTTSAFVLPEFKEITWKGIFDQTVIQTA